MALRVALRRPQGRSSPPSFSTVFIPPRRLRCTYICASTCASTSALTITMVPRVDNAVVNVTVGPTAWPSTCSPTSVLTNIVSTRFRALFFLFIVGIKLFVEIDFLSEGYFCECQDVISFCRSRSRCYLIQVIYEPSHKSDFGRNLRV